MSELRVRFAPSPTGFLHIGGVRTAIFNWLLARNAGGKFLLRIEDTDPTRSKLEFEEDILAAMKALGLDWDEEPLRQSERLEAYTEVVESLLKSGNAYRCFLSSEESQALKEKDRLDGNDGGFRSPHRSLTTEETDLRVEAGEAYTVRFRIPDDEITYTDGVHGDITVPARTIEEFIIMRSDGTPTYQIAVVTDDNEMGINHVVRGDDHIYNTPKQILIYKSMGWEPPEFSHVPLILGSDRKRLSKRHGATAVSDYLKQGYMPEAVLSFMAMLGWSPGDEREVMGREELIAEFGIKGITARSSVFDEQKLEWVNGEFVSSLPEEYLIGLLQDELSTRIEDGRLPEGAQEHLPTAVSLLKSRCRFVGDIIEKGEYFFVDPTTIVDRKAAKKRLKDPATPSYLRDLADKFAQLDDFNHDDIEVTLRSIAEAKEVGTGKFIHPTRLAVSGIGSGPGLFELLEGLGKETVVRRMHWLAAFLEEKGTPPQLEDEIQE